MTRQARKVSASGFYHIVFRGVNHCHLFEDREDFERMLSLLERTSSELELRIHAYCLMDNHAHLLVEETASGVVPLAMKKLLGTYASWFNRKYQRSGALIANRYGSYCVESESYLLALVRYIHQNPLLSGMVRHVTEHRWSSYGDYVGRRSSFVCTELVMGQFASDSETAISEFVDFHDVVDSTGRLFFEGVGRSEDEVRQAMLDVLGGMEPNNVCGLPRSERNSRLMALREKGFSIRQIERATGVSKSLVARVVAGRGQPR